LLVARYAGWSNTMPHYHFLLGNKDAPAVEIVEYPNDNAAINEARRVLGEALRQAAQERQLLNEEIHVCTEDGTVIAIVACDGSARH
jgi:hypothetical protein